MVEIKDEPPLYDPYQERDIYADGVAEIEDLGDNFRVTYFCYGRDEFGHRGRVVVCRMVRPKSSLLRPGRTITLMLQNMSAGQMMRLDS